jgi:hypothetical protein
MGLEPQFNDRILELSCPEDESMSPNVVRRQAENHGLRGV